VAAFPYAEVLEATNRKAYFGRCALFLYQEEKENGGLYNYNTHDTERDRQAVQEQAFVE
jgi:hypothetical protein